MKMKELELEELAMANGGDGMNTFHDYDDEEETEGGATGSW